MIPPPNYMYQQGHGASNFPLNRNGILYPRHYYPYPPINVPPMQVCYDFPPPTAVSGIRGPHQANFAKSPSPVAWPPHTFQINPRNQPPSVNSKPRHPTPPRYRNPSDPSYPFTQSWNNWNMYQMSPHNMYANYNYAPGMVPPSFYPDGAAGRSYQGHVTKSKHLPVNRSQDQNKSQMPPVPTCVPNKIDDGVKNCKPIQANPIDENKSVSETFNQPQLSKSPESCNQNDSLKSVHLDNVSTDSSTPAVQNTHESCNVVQSTQLQASSEKACNSKCTSENKIVPDSSEETISKCQSTSPKTNSPPTNFQETSFVDISLQTNTVKPSSKNESSKTIDLSSLSAVLEDGQNKEKKHSSAPNNVTDEKLKSNPDQKEEISKIPLLHETNVTKECDAKESIAGASTKPCTSITTTAYNSQPSKYYKGRPIQSQPRTGRDGNLNNSYNNRKPVTGPASSFHDPTRENMHKPHIKLPNNGQQYYAMSYDNGANARAYNTQTYYVHQPPQTSQQMAGGYSSIPRPYMPQQHVAPEYQQVYQQPTEFVYYPSSSQAFYTAPMLMQPQVLAYHPPKVSCYNCGGQNHTGAECTELTMEEITSKGLYENHYGPSMPDGRPRN